MKTRTIAFALGLAALLAVSLFTYSRSETVILGSGSRSTSQWSADGAGLATVILSITLFVVGRRITHAIRVASQRAGLPQALPIPIAYRFVIAAAVPFLLFGWSSTSSEGAAHVTFGFGVSPYKLPAFLLVLLVVWLAALLQRLRALFEHITRQANED